MNGSVPQLSSGSCWGTPVHDDARNGHFRFKVMRMYGDSRGERGEHEEVVLNFGLLKLVCIYLPLWLHDFSLRSCLHRYNRASPIETALNQDGLIDDPLHIVDQFQLRGLAWEGVGTSVYIYIYRKHFVHIDMLRVVTFFSA